MKDPFSAEISTDIGRRAAAEIGQRAYMKNVSVSSEAERLGVFRQQLYYWQHGRAPSAVTLAAMAEEGYDILYILTGQKTA